MKKQPPRKLKKKLEKSPTAAALRVDKKIRDYIKSHKITLIGC